jgi:hypothetical protein
MVSAVSPLTDDGEDTFTIQVDSIYGAEAAPDKRLLHIGITTSEPVLGWRPYTIPMTYPEQFRGTYLLDAATEVGSRTCKFVYIWSAWSVCLFSGGP